MVNYHTMPSRNLVKLLPSETLHSVSGFASFGLVTVTFTKFRMEFRAMNIAGCTNIKSQIFCFCWSKVRQHRADLKHQAALLRIGLLQQNLLQIIISQSIGICARHRIGSLYVATGTNRSMKLGMSGLSVKFIGTMMTPVSYLMLFHIWCIVVGIAMGQSLHAMAMLCRLYVLSVLNLKIRKCTHPANTLGFQYNVAFPGYSHNILIPEADSYLSRNTFKPLHTTWFNLPRDQE